jgi:hypothetical protein
MRVFAAPAHGLGAPEVSAFRRLSPKSQSIVADELRDPESHETVRWILKHRDPEAALAEAIDENVHQASRAAASGAGVGDGLGRSFFKRLARIHRKVFNVFKKVDPGLHALTRKKRSGPPTGPPIVSQTAAVSAPTPTPTVDPIPANTAPPPPPPPDATQYTQPPVPVNYVQEQPPPDPSATDPSQYAPPPPPPTQMMPAQLAPTPAPATASISPSGAPYTTGTDETAGLPTATTGYTLTVEGQTISNYPVDITQIASLVQSGTQPGDRFEILADGVGTGLRVRTTTGFISIPDSMRAQVQAMPQGQVLALLTQAAASVAASGVPTPAPLPPAPPPAPAPAPGGNGTVWLLGAGGVAAALALAAAGGKRR